MRAYARRHYGLDRSSLVKPKVIVEHMTANSSYRATWNTFARDAPDPELGELPGTCAHFVVDPSGRIHQLVPLAVMCRHTVGLNYTAIGIEHVGTSDGALMGNRRMLDASLRLTRWLRARHGIAARTSSATTSRCRARTTASASRGCAGRRTATCGGPR